MHLVLSVARRWDGLGSAALELARAQRARGHDARTWCLDVYPLSPDEVRERLQPPDCVRIFPHSIPRRLGHSRSLRRATATDEAARFELLHQHGIWRGFSRAATRWRRVHGRPTVLSPAGTLEPQALAFSRMRKRLALWAYEAVNLREAACLVASSPREALGFRRFGLHNPVAVIPGGIPDELLERSGDGPRFRQSFGLPTDRQLLLYLSRIHPIKGLPLLIDALALLPEVCKDWLLVVAGPDEGGHTAELREQARRLGLEAAIRFCGPLHGDDKRDALAAARLFVLPTHSENFGAVVAEALAAGVPVVTTHGAPWTDLTEVGCGWHVAPSCTALAEALRDACRRPAGELTSMGERGRSLVSSRYRLSHAADKTLEMYAWLLGRAPRPSFVDLD